MLYPRLITLGFILMFAVSAYLGYERKIPFLDGQMFQMIAMAALSLLTISQVFALVVNFGFTNENGKMALQKNSRIAKFTAWLMPSVQQEEVRCCTISLNCIGLTVIASMLLAMGIGLIWFINETINTPSIVIPFIMVIGAAAGIVGFILWLITWLTNQTGLPNKIGMALMWVVGICACGGLLVLLGFIFVIEPVRTQMEVNPLPVAILQTVWLYAVIGGFIPVCLGVRSLLYKYAPGLASRVCMVTQGKQ